jgi:hypothetical protein
VEADSTSATSQDQVEQERLSQKFQRELNAGLVGLVLLAVLEQGDEDLYGYQIAKRLQDLANGKPSGETGRPLPRAAPAFGQWLAGEPHRAVLRWPASPLLPDHPGWARHAGGMA